ncbi:MAG: proline--tRNA ligase [Erysipelotrichaceae bacterium]|jgi:prolyl-tRNA synthetase|nr:proline--tRNA ligase [Erysipelotrichaceae bacterium]
MIKNEAITKRSEDFAKWYTDICKKAELMDYSSVKGFIIYRPYGYAIWEEIQKYLDAEFKKSGHQNVYLPLVIPESLFNLEKEHVEGFAPETLIATIGGKEELEDRLIIRPTSEVLFTDHFRRVINSYRDLPVLYNQWCSVVRWEKTTRPFLRGSEFLWQEGHTMHRTGREAKKEALDILKVYEGLGTKLLAIPFVSGEKTPKEKFAGAKNTYSIEALMPDGKALQSGTTHYFGDGFAAAFGVKFLDKDATLKVPHQSSWGVSTRLIGSIIMVHGDDNGLVLPPYVAPIQLVIIPIRVENSGDQKQIDRLYRRLKTHYRVKMDDSSKSPGWKFSEYEMKGVPLRIEIGPRDLANKSVTLVRRIDSKKTVVLLQDLDKVIKQEMKEIHDLMLDKATKYKDEHTTVTTKFSELDAIFNDKLGYAKVMWCGDPKCEATFKEKFQATIRNLPLKQVPHDDSCIVCGKKAKKVALVAKAY